MEEEEDHEDDHEDDDETVSVHRPIVRRKSDHIVVVVVGMTRIARPCLGTKNGSSWWCWW